MDGFVVFICWVTSNFVFIVLAFGIGNELANIRKALEKQAKRGGK